MMSLLEVNGRLIQPKATTLFVEKNGRLVVTTR